MSDTATTDAPAVLGTFDAYDDTFSLVRKPPVLLIAGLSRTDTEDPAAVGMLYEFFELTMTPAEFARFRGVVYRHPSADDPELFGAALRAAVEAVMPETPTTRS